MQRINEDIKTGNFKQIYLLYGEERYLKNQYTTRLREACVDGCFERGRVRRGCALAE